MLYLVRINREHTAFNSFSAIKMLRSVTNLSLRDAKNLICDCSYLLVNDDTYMALSNHPDYGNHFMLLTSLAASPACVGVIDSKSIHLPSEQQSISFTAEQQDVLSNLAGGLQTITDEIHAFGELRNTKALAYLLLAQAESLVSYHGLVKRAPIQRWTFD